MFFNFQTIKKILSHRGLFATATTIMAVEFDGGVVIGADSRSSARNFEVDRVFDKLTPVTGKIYCCHSGIAADSQAMLDHVACQMQYYGSPGPGRSPPEVFKAACEFRNKSYMNRDIWPAGLIVAGWDDTKGGQVYSIPMGGMLARVPYAIVGSGEPKEGSSKEYVTNNFKPGMDLMQCIELITSAIRSDQSSGGVVCIGSIDKDGMKRHINYNTDCSPPDVSSAHSSFTFISTEREYTETDVSRGQSFTSFIRSLNEASNS